MLIVSKRGMFGGVLLSGFALAPLAFYLWRYGGDLRTRNEWSFSSWLMIWGAVFVIVFLALRLVILYLRSPKNLDGAEYSQPLWSICGEAFIHSLLNTFNFRGTTQREHFVWWWLFFFVILPINSMVFAKPLPLRVIWLFFLLSSISLIVRRIRDTGHSGWWSLTFLSGFLIPWGIFWLLQPQAAAFKIAGRDSRDNSEEKESFFYHRGKSRLSRALVITLITALLCLPVGGWLFLTLEFLTDPIGTVIWLAVATAYLGQWAMSFLVLFRAFHRAI